MWTKKFWRDARDRAIGTALATGVPLVVAAGTLNQVDWADAGWVTATAVALTVAKAMLGSLRGDPENGSLNRE